MFTTYSHLKAEDKYRREVLRDQSQIETKGRVGKAVTALVVAGALALAACGATASDTGEVQNAPARAETDLEYAFGGTQAPTPQGSRGLMSTILASDAADPELAFSGVEAPTAEASALDLPDSGPASGPR